MPTHKSSRNPSGLKTQFLEQERRELCRAKRNFAAFPYVTGVSGQQCISKRQ